MRTILREDESGVSEVVGTILILAMTVVLFSVIIVWVTNIPTPTAQARTDIQSEMNPIYNALGAEIGVNITLTHQGGEPLYPVPTIIYVIAQRGSATPQTDTCLVHRYNQVIGNGLLDGTDSVWDIGERWNYKSLPGFFCSSASFGPLRSSDQITIILVDNLKSIVLWTGPMNAPAGTRPPVFIDKWTDGILATEDIDPVQATQGFYIFAKLTDPDGDLNVNSVYATITAWYGSGTSCALPQQMKDNGISPDRIAGDMIFTLGGNACTNSPYPALTWAGSIILLNATDLKGHQTTTRLVLDVIAPTSGGSGPGTTIPSALWQYIGYVQIRTGEVWISNSTAPYTTPNTFSPTRVSKTWIGGKGLFHFKMANHGNTTIFMDGWTEAFFQNTQSSAGTALYIVAPCNPLINANAGGVAAYPGTAATITDFQYAHTGLPAGCSPGVPAAVFDINLFNQETGGTPYAMLAYTTTPFTAGGTYNWPSTATYFMSILISGMAGPSNYTYAQLQGIGSNPNSCGGLGPNYNPRLHLLDPIVACRTQWYSQVIPFVGMVVYS
jgi:flagellin-like protein